MFDHLSETCLIAAFNSVFSDSKPEASSEIKKIKTHVLYLMPVQFLSSINELIFLMNKI